MAQLQETLQITSRTSYVLKNQNGTFRDRLCRPAEMPKPFGTR